MTCNFKIIWFFSMITSFTIIFIPSLELNVFLSVDNRQQIMKRNIFFTDAIMEKIYKHKFYKIHSYSVFISLKQ